MIEPRPDQVAPEDERLLFAALGALSWLGRHATIVRSLAAASDEGVQRPVVEEGPLPANASPPLVDAALGIIALERRLATALASLAAGTPPDPAPCARRSPRNGTLLR